MTVSTYQEVARHYGIVPLEHEAELALVEATVESTPSSLRSLFTQLTLDGHPALRILCCLGLDLRPQPAPKGQAATEMTGDPEDEASNHTESTGISDGDGGQSDIDIDEHNVDKATKLLMT